MAVFASNANQNDTFIGSSGADTFNFLVADLTGADTLTGNGGTDTLVLTGTGILAAANFAGMTSVEALTFGNGGISVTFSDAVAAANGGVLAVTGSAGDDTLDYSAVTLATRSFNVIAGTGNDTLRGGAGNDAFRFNVSGLTSADTVQGGSGTVDQLIFETAGTISATNLANVGGIERVVLANGTNDLTLTAAMGASALNGLIQVFGNAGNDRVSATGLTAGALVDITAGAGLDTLFGSLGNDIFRFGGVDLAGDTVNGGAGYDTLSITSADALSAIDLALVSNIDQINLNAAGTSVTIDNTIALANAGLLSVFGSTGNDVVDASAVVTSSRALSVTANGGNDTLRGGGGNDTFRFNAVDLTAADIVSGGGGTGIDTINLLTAGTVSAANMAGVSGIERLSFVAGTNSVTLTNAQVGTATGGKMAIYTNTGDDTVDGSSLTGVNKLEIYASTGNDTLRGGAGNDVFRFTVAGLDGNDLVAGGTGSDELIMSSTGALTTAKLAQVSGIDQITLSNAGIQLTINNTVAAANAATLAIYASNGADVVDASTVTDTTRGLSVTAFGGDDTFKGGLGADTFRFNANSLNGLDTVQGGSGTSTDSIVFLAAGTVTAAGFANVSGIESISLTVGGISLALTDALVGSANGTQLKIFGSSGNDIVNAALVTTAANRIDVNAGAGNDTFTGGAGNDVFRFASADITGADTVNGGTGFDALILTTAGTIAAAQLAATSGLEQILLGGSGSSITFDNAALANNAATLSVVATAGSDTVDASAVTTARAINVIAGAGTDTLRGGTGADTFQFTAGNLTAADTVSGGGGSARDTLTLTSAGTLTAAALVGVSGIESVILANGTNDFNVTNAMVGSAAGTTLAVIGGTGDDLVNGGDVVTATNRLDITAGTGNDILFGGSGADTFRFAVAAFDAGDQLNGGLGAVIDTLAVTGAGTINLAGTNVAQIEALTTDNADHTILLNSTVVDSAQDKTFSVTAGTGADTLDVSRVTLPLNLVQVNLGDGADTLIQSSIDSSTFATSVGPRFDKLTGTLGAGNDLLKSISGYFDNISSLSGGNGTDTIEVNNYFGNTTAMNAGLTGFEVVNLVDTVTGGGYRVRFTSNDTAGLTVNGQYALNNYILTLGAGGQTANGNALNDSLFGGSGNDTLNGNGGNDFIEGLGGSNVSNGGAGDDTVVWHATDSVVTGGADNDTLVSLTGGNFDLSQADQSLGDSVNTSGFENVNLAQAYDPNTGYSKSGTAVGTVKGSSGVNIINGSSFGDVLDGNGGADSIYGNDGADTITYRGTEVEVNGYYQGTAFNPGQYDTLVLAAAATVNLGNSDQTASDTVLVAGFQNVDGSAISIGMTLIGDYYDNRIIGGSGGDVVAGNDGNDWLDGGAGADVVTGGNNDDIITYRSTASTITGNADTDTLRVLGAATINLNNGDQTSGDAAAVFDFENVNASASAVVVSAIGRNDLRSVLIGGSAGDTLTAGALGADITGNAGADTLIGGAGGDRFYINAGDIAAGESINGGADSDAIFIRATTNLSSASITAVEDLVAEAADSSGNVLAQNMTVTLTGAQAAGLTNVWANGAFYGSTVESFVVNVASGTTVDLSSTSYNDFDSNDTLAINGASGNETITGPLRTSIIHGNGGSDTLKAAGSIGGYWIDSTQVFGDSGNDRIDYGYSEYNTTLDGGADIDTLVFSYIYGGPSVINLGSATDQTIDDISVVRNFENLDWSGSNAGLEATGSSGANNIIGSQGSDVIDGGAGLDVIDGQAGFDYITYRSTASIINGGADADLLKVFGAVTINLNNGDQTSGDTVSVSGFEHVDASGSSAAVTLTGRADMRSYLWGGSAADTITAGAFGSEIFGYGGADTLNGGAGADSFYLNAGDFVAGEAINGGGEFDVLFVRATTDFTVGTLVNVEYVWANAQDAAGNYLEQGMTVTLTGAQAAGLQYVFGNGFYYGTTAETYVINVASGTTVNLSAIVWNNIDNLDTIAINGAGGNETITGVNYTSVMHGNGGNDTLRSANGNYWYDGTQAFGDTGNDRIDYGYRLYNTLLDGGADTDTLVYTYSEGVVDTFDLSSATDQSVGDVTVVRNFENLDWSISYYGLTVTGSSGANNIIGSQGNDTIDGGAGLDVIDGQSSNDLITYRSTASSIGGGVDTDTLRVLGAVTINLNNVDQTSGDTVTVTGFENVDGSGASAPFTATGRSGAFSNLIGGSAADTLTAGAYGASITGNGGADTLLGAAGEDYFFINAGDVAAGESINGVGGYDRVYVRGTTDFSAATLTNVEYLEATAADFSGNYLLQNMTVTLTGAQAAGLQVIYANGWNFGSTAESFIINVASGAMVDLSTIGWLSFDGSDTVTINGAAGNETITGPTIASVIRAGGGADSLKAPNGYWVDLTQVLGEAGNDRIELGYNGYNTVLDGGADSDTLVHSYLGGIADTIDLSNAADQSIGDTALVKNFENLDWSGNPYGFTATGSSIANTIIGGQNADTINGAGGDDIIDGQDGSDTLTGGTGSDVFVWMSRYSTKDTITDFLASDDDLRFAASAFDFNGAAFDQRLATASTAADITGKDLIIYTGGVFDSEIDVQNYMYAAAGGSAGEGVFIVGKDSSNHTVIYHAKDASFTVDPFVTEVADLGTLTAPTSIQLADFLFV